MSATFFTTSLNLSSNFLQLTSNELKIFEFLIARSFKNPLRQSWWRVKRIAKWANLDKRTIQRILKKLASLGLIIRDPRWREDGSQTSTLITICAENINSLPEEVKKDTVTPPVTGCHPIKGNTNSPIRTTACEREIKKEDSTMRHIDYHDLQLLVFGGDYKGIARMVGLDPESEYVNLEWNSFIGELTIKYKDGYTDYELMGQWRKWMTTAKRSQAKYDPEYQARQKAILDCDKVDIKKLDLTPQLKEIARNAKYNGSDIDIGRMLSEFRVSMVSHGKLKVEQDWLDVKWLAWIERQIRIDERDAGLYAPRPVNVNGWQGTYNADKPKSFDEQKRQAAQERFEDSNRMDGKFLERHEAFLRRVNNVPDTSWADAVDVTPTKKEAKNNLNNLIANGKTHG